MDLKKCPYCSELILSRQLKFKYYGEILPNEESADIDGSNLSSSNVNNQNDRFQNFLFTEKSDNNTIDGSPKLKTQNFKQILLVQYILLIINLSFIIKTFNSHISSSALSLVIFVLLTLSMHGLYTFSKYLENFQLMRAIRKPIYLYNIYGRYYSNSCGFGFFEILWK